MTDKIARYRKMAESLAELGDKHAQAIPTMGEKAINIARYMLMYRYFVRCAGLTSATIMLVETGHIAAAYALQKSVVDSMLNGLHIGYVAEDSDIEKLIELAKKGKGTGYSGMEKRAREIDAAIQKRRPFMTRLYSIVKRTKESLNEFGHGGLLSTELEARDMPPEVGYKALADSVLTLHFFLGNVFILENLDLTPLEALSQEFDEARRTADPPP
jgi:hypothetical protein